MYDIEHCTLISGDYPEDFSERINKWLAEGYVILPDSAYHVTAVRYKYTALVGKPRASASKELSI